MGDSSLNIAHKLADIQNTVNIYSIYDIG